MFNPYALSKAEAKSRAEYKCKHGHTGYSHPVCYDKGNGVEEKIGHLDIETTNLKANWGIVLSYAILDDKDNEILGRVLTPNEIRSGTYDKKLLQECCEDIRKFDRITTYNGIRFDIPFLRTRSIYWGIDFPLFREVKHTDVYFTVKHKTSFHSKRLGVVAPFFHIPAKDHPLNPEIWINCLSGKKEALEFVWTHNKEDIFSLKGVFHKLEDYTKLNATSL